MVDSSAPGATRTGLRARDVFLSSSDGRLRAGWRIALQLLLTAGLSVTAILAARAFLGRLPRTLAPLFLAPMATVSVYLCRRRLDRRTFRSLGLLAGRWALRDTLFGFLLSGFLVAGIFFLGSWAGWIRVLSTAWEDASVSAAIAPLLLGLVTSGLVVAWWEELVFRGYLLQNMVEGLGLRWAVAVSVLLYGLVHMVNPGASLRSGALIALIGVLRIYGWLTTRQLWLSMGMHAGWNFFQGPVFGFGVSGDKSLSVVRHEVTGPPWIMGGDFGPEAGLICFPIVLLALAAVFLWTRGRTAE